MAGQSQLKLHVLEPIQVHIFRFPSNVPLLEHLGGLVVERLPSAQGVILESRDRVPHRAPCVEPASPSACVSDSLSVSVSLCLS